MPAHHIVGVDLELGLGVELRIRRQHQNLRHLLAVRLLRVGPHDDLALEHAARAAVQNALEQLAAFAAGHRVIHDQRRVDMVGAASEEAAGDIELRALAGERRKHLIARQPRPCGQLKRTIGGRLADLHRPSGEMRGLAGIGDAFDVCDLGTFGDGDVRARIDLSLRRRPGERDMRLDQRELRAGFHGDDIARRDRLGPRRRSAQTPAAPGAPARVPCRSSAGRRPS